MWGRAARVSTENVLFLISNDLAAGGAGLPAVPRAGPDPARGQPPTAAAESPLAAATALQAWGANSTLRSSASGASSAAVPMMDSREPTPFAAVRLASGGSDCTSSACTRCARHKDYRSLVAGEPVGLVCLVTWRQVSRTTAPRAMRRSQSG